MIVESKLVITESEVVINLSNKTRNTFYADTQQNPPLSTFESMQKNGLFLQFTKTNDNFA